MGCVERRWGPGGTEIPKHGTLVALCFTTEHILFGVFYNVCVFLMHFSLQTSCKKLLKTIFEDWFWLNRSKELFCKQFPAVLVNV